MTTFKRILYFLLCKFSQRYSPILNLENYAFVYPKGDNGFKYQEYYKLIFLAVRGVMYEI